MIYVTLNDDRKLCNSCTIYIVLSIMFIIGVVISSAFICFHWYLKKVILILMLVLIPKQ